MPTPEEMARVAHEVNRVYSLSLGDSSHDHWEFAPAWQRDSCVAGVEAILANPNTTPEQSHENWLEFKEAEGWKLGQVKDAALKLHPSMVPYDRLPPAERLKDQLFRVVVLSMMEVADGRA